MWNGQSWALDLEPPDLAHVSALSGRVAAVILPFIRSHRSVMWLAATRPKMSVGMMSVRQWCSVWKQSNAMQFSIQGLWPANGPALQESIQWVKVGPDGLCCSIDFETGSDFGHGSGLGPGPEVRLSTCCQLTNLFCQFYFASTLSGGKSSGRGGDEQAAELQAEIQRLQDQLKRAGSSNAPIGRSAY